MRFFSVMLFLRLACRQQPRLWVGAFTTTAVPTRVGGGVALTLKDMNNNILTQRWMSSSSDGGQQQQQQVQEKTPEEMERIKAEREERK